ncbi:MAG: hypothetical protein ACE5IE_05530 [Dehalococcoidia bacterium]
MPKEKVQLEHEADEGSLLESILAKSYSDFATLVTKSYFPRFTEPSKATEIPVSKEQPVSPESGKEPQSS